MRVTRLPCALLLACMLSGCAMYNLSRGKEHMQAGLVAHRAGREQEALAELMAAEARFTRTLDGARAEEIQRQAAFLRGFTDLLLDELSFAATGNWQRAADDLARAYAADVEQSRLDLPPAAYRLPSALYLERYAARFATPRGEVGSRTYATLLHTAMTQYQTAIEQIGPAHAAWRFAVGGYLRTSQQLARSMAADGADAAAATMYDAAAAEMQGCFEREPTDPLLAFYAAQAWHNAGDDGKALGYVLIAQKLGLQGPARRAADDLAEVLKAKHTLEDVLPEK
jgi:hypothetical protein